MKTQSLILATLLAIVLASCGSSKKPAKVIYEAPKGEEVINVPCTGTKFQSDDKYFRASSDAIGYALSSTKSTAIKNAKALIAADISSTIQTVAQNYFNQRGSGFDISRQSKVEEMTVTVVNQVVNGAITICDITTRVTEEGPRKGFYRSYISQEFSIDKVVSAINGEISKDEELRIDYEYEKFKEQFELEMAKRTNSSN